MQYGHKHYTSPEPAEQLELPLGIDYAPAIVRQHGLRDTHIQPLVSRHKGESFRVHARDAWGYPSLELRAGNSWPLMGFDCDVPTVIESLHSLRSKFPLPYPNMVVERTSNGHCHASWFLSRPVHRGEAARAAPLRKLARINEYYREVLDADVGYAGVLTHNPLDEAHEPREFRTHWGHKCGRSLDELAEPIPKGWRLPVKPTTDTGRNCALFGSLMKWAGSPCNLKVEVIAMARATNDGLDAPLSDGEVTAIAKSIERYRRSWITQGRFYSEAEREAWGRSLGLQSAAARRKTNANRDYRIIEGHAAGWSQRHLAKLFKISKTGIWKVLQRHEIGE